jgi:hypothetical protein
MDIKKIWCVWYDVCCYRHLGGAQRHSPGPAVVGYDVSTLTSYGTAFESFRHGVWRLFPDACHRGAGV